MAASQKPSGDTSWAAVPVPGSQADADAEVAAPWLSAPIVKRAPGADPDKPWLDAPIVTPSGSSTDQPWLNDPIVSVASGSIPPLPPGYVLDHPQGVPPLPPGFTLDQPQQDTSFGSALQQGAHDALGGLGATAKVLSKDIGWKGGEDAGDAITNAVPAPANYQSASGDMVARIKAGQIMAALKDIPRAAVEGAPAVVGGLGAAALGAAAAPEIIGGAAGGGALGAGGYGAASAFGNDADARSWANGHAQPSAADQLAAAPTAIAQGALGAVGLGKVPGASALLKASPAYLRAVAAGGLDAAGQGAANLVGQVGSTVGTATGLNVDPSQAAAAALQGAAARAGGKLLSQTAGGAASGAGSAVRSIGMGLAAGNLPEMTPEQAASYTRLNNAYDVMSAQASSQRAVSSPINVMNAMWKEMPARLAQIADAAKATGQIDDATNEAFQIGLRQAQTHKSALPGTVSGEGFASSMGKLAAANIAPDLKQTLMNGLTDLDNLSQMVNYKQASGPFAALGAKMATPVAVIGGAAAALHGHPVEGLMTMAAPFLGTPGHGNIAGQYGAAVGGMLDKVAGTSLPPSLLLRAQAMKQAQAAGYDTSTNAIAPLSQTYDTLNTLRTRQAADALAQQSAQADAAAKAKAADLQEAAANKVSGMAYKQSEAGIIAQANAVQRRRDILAAAADDGRLNPPMSSNERLRVAVGLPPSDPIPVNVPLDANNRPLQGAQAQQRPPTMPRPFGVADALQGAQGAPQQAQSGYSPSGWLDHFRTQLANNGVAPTPQSIGTALARSVEAGHLDQSFVDHLLDNPQQFLGDRSVPFQQMVAQAVQDSGREPPPIVTQPVSPLKYGAAVQSRQALGTALSDQATAEGDPMLSIAIARIMATPEVSAKRSIEAHVYAQRQNDAAALERAQRLLPPELFRGKGS